MLTRGEDYAHQQPSLTKKKLRRLEITAGAPKRAKTAQGVWSTNVAIRQGMNATSTLRPSASSPSKPSSPTDGWSRPTAGASARKVGASATPERA